VEIKPAVLIIYTFAPDCRPPAPQTEELANAARLVSRNARQSKGIGGGSTKRPVTFTCRVEGMVLAPTFEYSSPGNRLELIPCGYDRR
jgi:hypothetical protein